MIEPIILGFFAGILLGLGFGSVFFALIQDSIDFGWRTGIKISSGVITGDFLLVAIAFAGTSFLPNIPHFGIYSRIIGAILLIGLGLSNFRKTTEKPSPKGTSKFSNFLYYFIKGFLLNVLNPSNFLSWVVASAALKSYKYETYEEIAFFITCIFSIFLTEAAISIFSYKIKDKLSFESIRKFKIGTAFIFFGVAIKLLFDAYKT